MPRRGRATAKNGTVPNRRENDRLRAGRKHLTESEIEKLMATARKFGRYGHRDATAILITYAHGLRVSELANLQWTQIDFQRATIQVGRLKGGTPSTHFLSGRELRALRQLRRENVQSRYLFVGERGELSAAWFRKMFARIGDRAKMPFPVHPHMLRHACGYKLANAGKDTRSLQGYLGHRDIRSTAVYTELVPDRFSGWQSEFD
jgi:type 1 fimbriae regulatory protein FimB/type 1 fimbriae regulatory protein FimE